jgi:hypothetical protein
MSIRRVRIVLLCEDSQQEAFTRRFLKGMGWDTREIRVEKSPSARGSAEHYVRWRFPKELKIYRLRKPKAASGLIVLIDADTQEVKDRINEFKDLCKTQNVPFREDNEAVAIGVPRRNIETWLYYLNGQQVNETDVYPKLERQRICQSAVTNLVKMCQKTGLAKDAPPSLVEACDEYRNRIKPLAKFF